MGDIDLDIDIGIKKNIDLDIDLDLDFLGGKLLISILILKFLQASARQKPVSKRLAHFSCLVVTTLLLVLTTTVLGHMIFLDGLT